MTPQPDTGSSKPQNGRRRSYGKGKKLSREKRDQLCAEGKCFHCEQLGHSQRDCPKLNTLKPPTVRANNVSIARLERISKKKDKVDLQVGSVLLELGIVSDEDEPNDSTPEMRRAYESCATAWGRDLRWLYPETHWESKYRIYQYGVQGGELVEIVVDDSPGVGTLEIDVNHLRDPDFEVSDMVGANSNNVPPCVREGGFRDRKNYKIWEW